MTVTYFTGVVKNVIILRFLRSFVLVKIFKTILLNRIPTLARICLENDYPKLFVLDASFVIRGGELVRLVRRGVKGYGVHPCKQSLLPSVYLTRWPPPSFSKYHFISLLGSHSKSQKSSTFWCWDLKEISLWSLMARIEIYSVSIFN